MQSIRSIPGSAEGLDLERSRRLSQQECSEGCADQKFTKIKPGSHSYRRSRLSNARDLRRKPLWCDGGVVTPQGLGNSVRLSILETNFAFWAIPGPQFDAVGMFPSLLMKPLTPYPTHGVSSTADTGRQDRGIGRVCLPPEEQGRA